MTTLVLRGVGMGAAEVGAGAAASGATLASRSRAIVTNAFPSVNLPIPEAFTTIEQIVRALADAERQSVMLANRYLLAHNQGRLVSADYVAYDGVRHGLNNAQVSFLAGLRAALYATVGTAIGQQTMAQIPWPGWLPRLEPSMGQVELVGVPQALGGLGVAPIVIAAAVLVAVAALVIVAWSFDKFTDSMVRMLAQYAFCRTSDAVMEQRERIYTQCVSGGGTPRDCAVAAASLNADVARALEKLNDLNGNSINAPLAVGASIAAALVAGFGIWVYVRKKAGKAVFPRSGTAGIGRRVRKRRARLGAVKLTSLKDPVPSRYMLEV